MDEPIEARRTGSAARYLVIGDNTLAKRICGRLSQSSRAVIHLQQPDDEKLFDAMSVTPRAVAIALHDDVAALRYALAVAHIEPSTHIVVTVFDRTISARLTELQPQATVTSPADLGAPALAAACLDLAGARR